MKEILNAVVVGGIHHNTLGVIRSLGDNKISKINITLILIDEKLRRKNFVTSSKYIKKKNLYLIKDDSEILDTLLSISADNLMRTIICCSDGSAEVVCNPWHSLPRPP